MATTGFTRLGFGAVEAQAPPPPPSVKLTRFGVAAQGSESSDGDGPAFDATLLASGNAALGSGRVKAYRKYLQDPVVGGVVVPDRITAASAAISQMAGIRGVAVVSGRWTTQAHFTQLRSDLLSMDPGEPFVIIAHHEPVTNQRFTTAAAWVAIQNMLTTATAGISYVVPAFCWNGYWFSGGAQNRNKMVAQGGFAAWAPASMLQAFVDQRGYAMMDAYDGGINAKPGNSPPTAIAPGESPGVRIRNFAKWCAGQPFTDNKGTIAGSPVVMPKIGCGEVGTFDTAHMYDTFAAAAELLDIACWWDHRGDSSALEDVSPHLVNGNGGNPDSAKYKAEYIRVTNVINAAGGPPPVTAIPPVPPPVKTGTLPATLPFILS